MTYSRDNGGTTPNLAGMVTAANSLRINDGTFVLTRCDLFDSAPVRSAVGSLTATHGGYSGTSFYDLWPFVIEGYLTVPTLADVWGAKDDLKGAFNLDAGLQTLVLNCAGWSGTRQISAIIAGPIQFLEPVMLEKLVPDRDFVIPCSAPDPRLYDTTLQTVTVTTGTTLTNAGTASAPFIARFEGPQTGPATLTDPSGNTIEIGVGIAGGGVWVEVNTRDPATGTMTAVDNTGANVMEQVSSPPSSIAVAPGAHAWSATNAGGAGATKVKFRNAWS